MRWFLERYKSIVADSLLTAIPQFFFLLLPGIGLVAFDQLWSYFLEAPVLTRFLILELVILPLAIYGRYYLLSPMGPGCFTSRYWLWFRLPLRRVSFDFSNYLGMFRSGGVTSVQSFQIRLRANWGSTRPKEAVLTSCISGQSFPLSIAPTTANANVDFVSIEKIPLGQWFGCTAALGGLPAEEFMQQFGHFRLIIRWVDRPETHIEFTVTENEQLLERFSNYGLKKPPADISLKST